MQYLFLSRLPWVLLTSFLSIPQFQNISYYLEKGIVSPEFPHKDKITLAIEG